MRLCCVLASLLRWPRPLRRLAVLLLRLHMDQLTSSPTARPVLLRLQRRLRPAVQVRAPRASSAAAPRARAAAAVLAVSAR